VRPKPVDAVAQVSRPVAKHGEGVIRHRLDRFGHRDDAGGLPALLVGRPMTGDPPRDLALFLLVQRELLGALTEVCISAVAEVSTESPMGLRGHVPRDPFIGIDVEQDTPVLRREKAALRRRCGMHECALGAIAHERRRKLRPKLPLAVAAFCASRSPLLLVRALELVVPRSLSKEIFKRRWAIVRRRGIDTDDALLVITVVPRRGPMAKIGRNDPCPCWSGQKYKRCCLPRDEAAERAAASERAAAPAREEYASSTYAMINDDGLDEASNRVIDLIDAGRLDEAEQGARDLLEKYPEVHDSLERLAMVYAARGDRPRAAEYYRKAGDFVHDRPDQYDPEMEAYLRRKTAEFES